MVSRTAETAKDIHLGGGGKGGGGGLYGGGGLGGGGLVGSTK